MMNIRIAGEIQESIVDGPGIRYVVFTQGCPHHCVGCHNPETHDFTVGKIITTNELIENMKHYSHMTGLTISGGEPFAQVAAVLELICEFKTIFPTKNILLYTGYTIEELWNKNDKKIIEILSLSDFLVDGKFINRLKDLTLIFRGSSNQRIIDLKKTFKEKKIIIQNF